MTMYKKKKQYLKNKLFVHVYHCMYFKIILKTGAIIIFAKI